MDAEWEYEDQSDTVSNSQYWSHLWLPRKSTNNMCVQRVGEEYFVSSNDRTFCRENDIGPYPTLEEAQIAAIVLARMGAGPK